MRALRRAARCAQRELPPRDFPSFLLSALVMSRADSRNHRMGAGASKGSGVAATTVRRALPKAGDAAAVAATTSGRASTRTQEMLRHDAERQLQERREASQSTSSSSPRSEHSFFRPMARNDGTLAPVKPAEVDVQKMVGEKDQTLVKRMDQLAGGISMSRLEISGHVRAREIAQKRRTAQEGRLRIKTANARDILREAAGDPTRFDPRVVGEGARHGRGDGGRTDAMVRRRRHRGSAQRI